MGTKRSGRTGGARPTGSRGEAPGGVSSTDVGGAEVERWRQHFLEQLERDRPRDLVDLVAMLERDCRRHGAEMADVGPAVLALVGAMMAERAVKRVREALRRAEQARERRDKRLRMLRELAERLRGEPLVTSEQRAELRAHRQAYTDAAARVVASARLLEQAIAQAEQWCLDAEDTARQCARLRGAS